MKPTAPLRSDLSVFATTPAVAYLFLVRPMHAQSVIALLMIMSVQLWPAHAHAADSDAVGRAYTLQATDVARRVVLAELVKHPERIHRMSMKCTFQLDRQNRSRARASVHRRKLGCSARCSTL